MCNILQQGCHQNGYSVMITNLSNQEGQVITLMNNLYLENPMFQT